MTNPQPIVSIIMPMYNAEQYLATCLKTIEIQSMRDFELIIIDDCSTDHSAEIVQKLYGSDSRFKMFRNLKKSRSDISRNNGLMIARGKYIYFMDSDDAIAPNALETLVNEEEKSQADVVIMNSRYDTEDTRFTFPLQVTIEKYSANNPKPRFFSDDIAERIKDEYLKKGVQWEPWTRIQRRDFLLENGIHFPSTMRAGDRLFHFAETCFAEKIQVIDFCGYIYHHYPKQTTRLSNLHLLKINSQSIPPAIEYIHEIVSKSKLLESVSEKKKFEIEIDALLDFFEGLFVYLYKAGIDPKKINETLMESMIKPGMCEPRVITALINMLARRMIKK